MANWTDGPEYAPANRPSAFETPVAEPLERHARPASMAFLIGPEGGLADAEVEQAKGRGFQAARLGPRVLRTESAPVVALSVAQQLWGDF